MGFTDDFESGERSTYVSIWRDDEALALPVIFINNGASKKEFI